ncbi:MAG TPA: hypothetical protein VHV10_20325 [Ktedonobacteraceae bacterium]|jgi:hypothetical protein|nr:hypothetical protein [Ktedonobacteraceae bacterium]
MLNTEGAAARLGCSVTWIRKLATKKDIKNKIRAYVYLDGVLTEHNPNNPRPGLELFFDEKDLDAYKPARHGRSMGSKDKPGRKSRAKKKPEETTKSPDIAEVLDSLQSAMAMWPGSWSEHHRLAWVYGIIVGWGENEEEIFGRFGWDEETKERFRQYRRVIEQLQGEKL